MHDKREIIEEKINYGEIPEEHGNNSIEKDR